MTMKTLPNDLVSKLQLSQYPRSSSYDPVWVLENLMGPNVLWLAESLTQVMDLRPGMRVLDMGCGKAISSIFLAKEFGAKVWANDLWINATENWSRIQAANLQDQVCPIQAEAHELPYAEGFFDALVSFDAYHYFGTNDLYLGYYARFVKPGGLIGIVVPGIQAEFAEGLPDHLSEDWDWEFWSFHSPAWWKRLWNRTGKVAVTHADMLPDGWRQWHLWLEVCQAAGYPMDPKEMAMLERDAGRNLGFSRVVAQRTT